MRQSERFERSVRIKPNQEVRPLRNGRIGHYIYEIADPADNAELSDQVDDNDWDRGFQLCRF
jgi:hypothetical protein